MPSCPHLYKVCCHVLSFLICKMGLLMLSWQGFFKQYLMDRNGHWAHGVCSAGARSRCSYCCLPQRLPTFSLWAVWRLLKVITGLLRVRPSGFSSDATPRPCHPTLMHSALYPSPSLLAGLPGCGDVLLLPPMDFLASPSLSLSFLFLSSRTGTLHGVTHQVQHACSSAHTACGSEPAS